MIGFVFPGQGSQSVGMLSTLARVYPEVEATFAEASVVLDYDLWGLVREGPESELNQTDRTQPAMLAAGVAVWRVWHRSGGRTPDILAGHSLGEYSALVCADALPFADAVALVAARGRFMQDAVPASEGAMAAILGLDDAQVAAVCAAAAAHEVVAPANFNSTGQVVVAGHTAAVKRAMELARQAGAKRAILLPVSVPSHCVLMEDAASRLAERLLDVPLRSPRVPIIHNADLRTRTDPADIRAALTAQLYRPVRWVETVRGMAAAGVGLLVECGPGKVLAGLNRRIVKDLPALPVFDRESLDDALAATGRTQ